METLRIPWILSLHRQLFVIINQARPVAERNIVTEEVTGMKKNANCVSMNGMTDIETSTDIVDMLVSLWKGPNVWKVPKEIATGWSGWREWRVARGIENRLGTIARKEVREIVYSKI